MSPKLYLKKKKILLVPRIYKFSYRISLQRVLSWDMKTYYVGNSAVIMFINHNLLKLWKFYFITTYWINCIYFVMVYGMAWMYIFVLYYGLQCYKRKIFYFTFLYSYVFFFHSIFMVLYTGNILVFVLENKWNHILLVKESFRGILQRHIKFYEFLCSKLLFE